ncbi:MAG: hypothetical protein AAGF01_16580 [Cyanobacteria bacterium P01_G01_bin.38]
MSNRVLGQLDDRGLSSTRRDFSLLIGVSGCDRKPRTAATICDRWTP